MSPTVRHLPRRPEVIYLPFGAQCISYERFALSVAGDITGQILLLIIKTQELISVDDERCMDCVARHCNANFWYWKAKHLKSGERLF